MKRCEKHPKYRGKRLPKNNCLYCAQMYFILTHAPRVEHKGTKAFRDKTKYNRKEKRKKPLE